MSRRVFFILGMHRSGTSYLAQVLSIMGLELPRSIQGGALDNPKGHFESFDIAQFHDGLLKELSSSWDSFNQTPESWFLSEYALEATNLLSERFHMDFPGSGPIVLKDPRLSLFMPLWKKFIQQEDLESFYILPIRHPLDVAASLNKRNKIGVNHSCLIWLNYLFSAESCSRDQKRSFIEFPSWAEDLEQTIEKVERDLGSDFPNKNKRNLFNAKNEFEQKFIHSKFKETRKARNDIESLCFSTYEEFLKLIKDPMDAKALKKIDLLKIQFDEIVAVYGDIYFELEMKYSTEYMHLNELKKELATKSHGIQQQLNETIAQVGQLEESLQSSQVEKEEILVQSNSIQQQLSETTAQVGQLEESLQSSQVEKEEVLVQSNSLQQQLSETTAQVGRLEESLQNSQVEKEETLVQSNSMQQQLSETTAQVGQLEESLQSSQVEKEEILVQSNSIQQQLSETTVQMMNLEGELDACHVSKDDLVVQLNVLMQKLNEQESLVRQLEEQQQNSKAENEEVGVEFEKLQQNLQTEKEKVALLQSEINDLKVQNSSLSKEYEKLILTYNNEQLTVFRPIYRNLYKRTGLFLRKAMPLSWVESIKRISPHPNGVPKQLTYQPQISTGESISCEQFHEPTIDVKPDIFVLSIINWDFRIQRPQHIAKGLSENGNRVFYLEMELSDKGPMLTKVTDSLYRANLSGKNIGHIQAYTGRPTQEQTIAWVNAFYELCNSVKSTSFKRIIIQHPFWWQLAKHLSPEYQIIFDCMDDISGFSNTEQFLLDLEQDMLQRCDKLVVSSQYLYDKYKHFQIPVLVRNAAELTHFDNTKKENSAPEFLKLCSTEKKKSNKINVGYVGAIAEWFDTELIEEAALISLDVDFHLCGAVTTKEAAQLDEIKNINMYGEISYSDVPAFLNEMDVLIIPFKLVPIIQACDPVKFYEYSAMGKPTVTTALPELARASELTFVASNATEFSEQIHNAYKTGKKSHFRKQLQEYAANNTWKHRTDQFEKICSDEPKVSIVILSYGDPELTKASLHSLYDGGPSYPNMEILIVDNGSSLNAIDEIKQFAISYPNVRVIENGENLGFAKGNNVGLEAATGEYVMLLNNDTVVPPGSIYAMVRHLINSPAIGVVGPLTNNIGNEAKLFVDYENMEQMKDVARQATTGYRSMYSSISVVAYFAVMLRKEDLKIFGLLPDDYGRGMFEDDDHCAMIKSKGFICALAEDAYIHHHLSATFSKLDVGEKEALFEKNKETFEKKWGKWKPHAYREERPISSLIIGDAK